MTPSHPEAYMRTAITGLGSGSWRSAALALPQTACLPGEFETRSSTRVVLQHVCVTFIMHQRELMNRNTMSSHSQYHATAGCEIQLQGR